jgi:type II secretion system protein G
MYRRGFTLIEALVVLVIMGIVMATVAFSMLSSRSSARDERRKADLAAISSALVKYRADCGKFLTLAEFNAIPAGGSLKGDGSTPSCLITNTYISNFPADPKTSNSYPYNLDATRGFQLCASLEAGGNTVSGCNSCGSTPCNYAIKP